MGVETKLGGARAPDGVGGLHLVSQHQSQRRQPRLVQAAIHRSWRGKEARRGRPPPFDDAFRSLQIWHAVEVQGVSVSLVGSASVGWLLYIRSIRRRAPWAGNNRGRRADSRRAAVGSMQASTVDLGSARGQLRRRRGRYRLDSPCAMDGASAGPWLPARRTARGHTAYMTDCQAVRLLLCNAGEGRTGARAAVALQHTGWARASGRGMPVGSLEKRRAGPGGEGHRREQSGTEDARPQWPACVHARCDAVQTQAQAHSLGGQGCAAMLCSGRRDAAAQGDIAAADRTRWRSWKPPPTRQRRRGRRSRFVAGEIAAKTTLERAAARGRWGVWDLAADSDAKDRPAARDSRRPA